MRAIYNFIVNWCRIRDRDGTRWSEHIVLSQTQFEHRLSSVQAPVCRLSGVRALFYSGFAQNTAGLLVHFGLPSRVLGITPLYSTGNNTLLLLSPPPVT